MTGESHNPEISEERSEKKVRESALLGFLSLSDKILEESFDTFVRYFLWSSPDIHSRANMAVQWQNRGRISCLALGAGLLFSSCSSLSTGPPQYGKEIEVAHAEGPPPGWIGALAVFRQEHPEKMWFTGVARKKTDLEEGRQDAYISAIGSINRRLRNTVRTEFNKARTSDPEASPFLYTRANEKAIEAEVSSRAMATLTGANAEGYWWKKSWIKDSPESPVQYHFTVHCLVSMNPSAYRLSVIRTLEGVSNQLENPDARRIVRFMTELVRREGPGR